MDRAPLLAAAGGLALLGMGGLAARDALGKRPDGTYRVASGRLVKAGSMPFKGRGADMAMHDDGETLAILAKDRVFLVRGGRVVEGSETKLPKTESAAKGLVWAGPNRLVASAKNDTLLVFEREGDRLLARGPIPLKKEGREKATPGGLCLSPDGTKLYVPLADAGLVLELDARTGAELRSFPVLHLPADVATDGRTLVVCDWGGRPALEGEKTAKSGKIDVVVDREGVDATGAVTLIELASGRTTHVATGRHPTAVAIEGGRAFVTCAADDRIDEIDLAARKNVRSLSVSYDGKKVFGAMPVELAVTKTRIYAADGGDDALVEIDRKSGKVVAFRAAGFFPSAVLLRGKTAYVLNSKGNGSVANTAYGRVGNAHDFEGSLTTLDLSADPKAATAEVARLNGWNAPFPKPKLAVYNGAIKRVLYIIKENRTYDEVYGDMPQGDGDPKLCSVGEKAMPNHRAIARQYTLFDNGYVSGTNSADGHAWSTQSIANDYEELSYVGGYPRSYPDEGNDAMSYSTGGFLWNLAERAGKKVRVYGEFMNEASAEFLPRRPKDWFEAWDDYKTGGKTFTYKPVPQVASLARVANPRVHYWPLLQSDQARADEFLREYKEMRAAGKLWDFAILTLPCDHTEGTDPKYPTPRAMMADNDLALGRVVEFISSQPEWKETAIFVIEDDAQSGPDHVDGHRTIFSAISPYNRRGNVDSTLYTTCSMIRSIELILGLPPMNRFDALARPIEAAFHDKPDLTPYKAVPNNVPLDEPNPGRKKAMTAEDRYWAEKTADLDWSGPDAADFYWLNRIVWHSLRPGVPYPGRPGERPGQVDAD